MSDKTAMWRSRVAAWRASGQTAEVFAADHGFPVGTLRGWSSRLGREERRAAAPPVIRLARVVRAARAESSAPSSSGIVIELRDVSARIAIDGSVDRQTLATVLAVLREGTR